MRAQAFIGCRLKVFGIARLVTNNIRACLIEFRNLGIRKTCNITILIQCPFHHHTLTPHN